MIGRTDGWESLGDPILRVRAPAVLREDLPQNIARGTTDPGYCLWATISKTSGTDAVLAKKTIPQMRFHQVLMLWTCFPCMFDVFTMLKLC